MAGSPIIFADRDRQLIPMFRNLAFKALAIRHGIKFLFQNIRHASKLARINTGEAGEIVIRGMKNADVAQVNAILLLLNNGAGLSWSRRLLYQSVGTRIGFVAVKTQVNEIIGADLFYFNPRDLSENTIHEGFIGVLPAYQGQGVASRLRSHAIEILGKSKLAGISTRISVANAGSFKSADKMGFQVVDRYFDSGIGEERCYLVRYF